MFGGVKLEALLSVALESLGCAQYNLLQLACEAISRIDQCYLKRLVYTIKVTVITAGILQR